MFCGKCGNELRNGETFCPRCGTNVGVNAGANFTPNANPNGGQYANPNGGQYAAPNGGQNGSIINTAALNSFKNNFISGAQNLGKNKVLVFITMGALLLSMILAMIPTYKATILFGSITASMFQGSAFLRVLFILAYLASIVFLCIPLLFQKQWNFKYFLAGEITTIAAVGWSLLGLISASSGEYSEYAKISYSAGGWMFLIVTVATAVLCFKTCFDIKKSTVNPIQPNFAQPNPVQPNFAQPNPVQPNFAQPNPVQPNFTQPNPVQPNFAQPNPVQPNFTQPNPVQPNDTTSQN